MKNFNSFRGLEDVNILVKMNYETLQFNIFNLII